MNFVLFPLCCFYDPAHEEFKMDFLTELASLCSKMVNHYVIGGDFNILRDRSEKNKQVTLSHASDLFNSIIHSYNLREIHMSGGMYTWSNKQQNPTLEKLGRILMSPA